MVRFEIIAAGRLKNNGLDSLCAEYEKRMQWQISIHEVISKYKDAKTIQDDEHRQIQKLIHPNAYLIVLDERGKTIKSLDFSRNIDNQVSLGQSHFQCILGGADGLNDEIRNRANLLLSFGKQTWPHQLARVMLLEQIYRAQQIIAGHPYHRE